MKVCKEKPDNLPPLEAIGIERQGGDDSAAGHAMHRSRSDRRSTSISGMPPPAGGPPNRQGTIGLGIGVNQFGKNQAGGFRMGEFAMGTNNAMRNVTGPPGM